MFAKSLIIKTNGFKSIPIISTGVNISNTGLGTPGMAKICCQYVFFALSVVIIKTIDARIMGTAMLPVRFAPPGKIGIRPRRLFNQIKKNTVSKKGIYLI